MKTGTLFTFLMCGLLLLQCKSVANQPVHIMTFNIRYGLANDGLDSWQYRKQNVVNLIEHYHPDIVGLQEALGFQLAYLDSSLKHYSWIGVAREDGKQQGEYTAVLYDSTRFQMLQTATFWLSE